MKIKEAQTLSGVRLEGAEIVSIPSGMPLPDAEAFIRSAGERGEYVFDDSLLGIARAGQKTANILRVKYPSILAFSLATGAKLNPAGVGGREKSTVHGLTNGIASAWGHGQD